MSMRPRSFALVGIALAAVPACQIVSGLADLEVVPGTGAGGHASTGGGGSGGCGAGACGCGAIGDPCCAGDACGGGAVCEQGTCAPCGAAGQPCCAATPRCEAALGCAAGTCAGCAAAVAAGGVTTCALRSDRTLWCWGANYDGQLGVGTADDAVHPSPEEVTALGGEATGVRASEALCATRLDEALLCWGDNSYGQLGAGVDTTPITAPTPVAAPPGTILTRVAPASHTHSCAISDLDELWCWGDNGAGQLGIGVVDFQIYLAPIQAAAVTFAVAAVEVGDLHVCALDLAGNVWCWGDTYDGQIGIGVTTDAKYPSPEAVSIPDTVERIAARGLVTCAVTWGGALWCWGSNNWGQIGPAAPTVAPSPVELTALGDEVRDVSVGGHHVCAIKTDATVWCWGSNKYGQLGIPFEGDIEALPQQVAGLADVVEISCGYAHTCARTGDGRLWCWGTDNYGQLGRGEPAADNLPGLVQLACPDDVDP